MNVTLNSMSPKYQVDSGHSHIGLVKFESSKLANLSYLGTGNGRFFCVNKS